MQWPSVIYVSSPSFTCLYLTSHRLIVYLTSLWCDPFICISLRPLIVVSIRPRISAYWRLGGQRLHNSNTCSSMIVLRNLRHFSYEHGSSASRGSLQINLSKRMLIFFKSSHQNLRSTVQVLRHVH